MKSTVCLVHGLQWQHRLQWISTAQCLLCKLQSYIPFWEYFVFFKSISSFKQGTKTELFSAFGRNVMEFNHWSYVCTWLKGLEVCKTSVLSVTFVNAATIEYSLVTGTWFLLEKQTLKCWGFLLYWKEKKTNKAIVLWHANTVMTKCHNCGSVNNELG